MLTTSDIPGASLLHAADLTDDLVLPPGSWRRRAADRLVSMLGSRTEPYPCVFGADALRKGGLRFLFVDDADTDAGAATLAAGLRQFAAVFPMLPKRSSLVTFLDVPARAEVAGYEEAFWRTLSRLRRLDDQPWPADIAADPEDPWWEFCFAGMAMFVVCATAAHGARRSRAADGMMITFQPRPVFDGLEPETRAGHQARVVIRGRLASYDRVPPHPALGPYGDAGHREWRQYFLPDADLPGRARCPLDADTGSRTRPSQRRPAMTQPASTVPEVRPGPELGLHDAVHQLLPTTGSVEVQRDTPGREHAEHEHPTPETLLIVDGSITFWWRDGSGDRRTASCGPGERLLLPAGTRHGSAAGADGCVYVIAQQYVA